MVDLLRESLSGKLAVVNGVGAGQGMSTIRAFINSGAKVAIISRSGDTHGLTETSQIRAFKCDSSDPDQIKETAKKISTEMGDPDFLINNIGKWSGGDDLENEEAFLEMLKFNTASQYNAIYAFLPFMKNKGGAIVNIGASEALRGASSVSYSASKYAIEEITKVLASRLKKYNIRVNSIKPGSVIKEDTFFNVFPFKFAEISEDKVLQPLEVAYISLFLCSKLAQSITGQSITADRGTSL